MNDLLDKPLCSICNRKAKNRFVTIPIIKGDGCICERCFEKLPYDFHRKVLFSSENPKSQAGNEFNEAIIEAMKGAFGVGILSLNTGLCLFYKNDHESKFIKFRTKGEFMRHLKDKIFGNHLIFIEGFSNGRIIKNLIDK